jgi:hypothetical protein
MSVVVTTGQTKKGSRKQKQDTAATTGEAAEANAAAAEQPPVGETRTFDSRNAQPGMVDIDRNSPEALLTTEEPAPQQEAAEEVVELTLASPRLVQYVVAEIDGKSRWLETNKLANFDLETGKITMTKTQATAWKIGIMA